MAARTTGALIALSLTLSLAGCEDRAAVEALEREKAELQSELVALRKEQAALTAELASRPPRAATFEERARKIVEVFQTCADPCARIFVEHPEKVKDPEQHAPLKQTIGHCVAKCMR